ncbi:MAG: NAD(P)-dependent oxidoreductase [Chloroflexi bacterium]|nr:NAD(P)-dependent oxidoreductase [Chloroflexota bacterium]
MNLAFIGTGVMGSPMAENLARGGHQLTVWNRTRTREAPVLALGARSAATPLDALAGADAVHVCLLTGQITRELLLGNDGLLATMQPGQVLVDHGTSGVAVARELAAAGAERGIEVLDAPISGGVEGARAGTLAIMAAGSRAGFERVLPAFESMGKTIRFVGPAGSGQALKLANQLLVVIHQLAAAEAFGFARKAGVDGELFHDILLNAWGRSFMMERGRENFVSNTFEQRANPGTLAKDLNLVRDSARELGARLDLTEAAGKLWQELLDRGYAGEDITAALKLY